MLLDKGMDRDITELGLHPILDWL